MSRIRHLVWPTQSDARNSCADENARAAKPNSFSKSGSDSRTDSSSSTTDTSERVTFIISCRTRRGCVSECRDRSRPPSNPRVREEWRMKTRLGGSSCPKDAPHQWRAPLCLGIASAPISTPARRMKMIVISRKCDLHRFLMQHPYRLRQASACNDYYWRRSGRRVPEE
jgi:hypothetical protein